MAQKREKEVTELKVPESLPMRIQTISSPQQISVARPPEISDPNASGACDRRASSADSQPDPLITEEKQRNSKRPREATRCSGSDCRKRVGLTGFRCRCGDVFCSQHRYSDRHDCSYDYKTAGREAIARQNPVVRAAKLVKV